MGAKRVVLVRKRSLLAATLHRLLDEDDAIALRVVVPDDPDADERIREWDPQAIVIDSGDPALTAGMITRLLQSCPTAEVIAMTADQPGIEVYRMQRVPDTDFRGLVQLIQHDGVVPAGGPLS